MNWDANLIWVLSGTLLLSAGAAVIGGFAVLRQRALIGDVLAHAALPGIMMAFILFNSYEAWLVFFSALVSSLLGYYLIGWITRHSKIKADAAMAIVLSSFFALGLMALSYIQSGESTQQTGLDRLLFGQAAAMTLSDVYMLSLVALISLSGLFVLFQKLRLISFDRHYATTLGLPVARYELSFALMLVMSIVVGLHVVGVVLMAAVLLIPITIARFWSHNLTHLLWIAALVSSVSALISSQISFYISAMPTGPWMVFILGVMFFVSWFAHSLWMKFKLKLNRPRHA